MKQEETSTHDNIINAAKAEFLEKGYQKASLRSIVKTAGVTTGAFYRYYDSKEALFASLVEETSRQILKIFTDTVEDFQRIPETRQSSCMREFSGLCLTEILNYIYEHYDNFKLLICCSDGTPYGNFTQSMVSIEEGCTYRYMEDMEKLGFSIPFLDRRLSHTIITGMFTGMLELIAHDTPKEEAEIFIKQFQEFYTAGWSKILGMDF